MAYILPVSRLEAENAVKIGVLAKRGTARCVEKWELTADYLSHQIQDYTFEIVPLGYGEIFPATEREEVDFILVNPSYYVAIEMQYGASRIATLKNLSGKEMNTTFGGVVFCRADRNDLASPADFKGKSFMSVHEYALGAWHSVWLELTLTDFDPFRDFADVQFAGTTHDSVVYAVREGIVDIGAVRTGTLERMSEENCIDIDDFRVFRFPGHAKSEYSYLLSTKLYPEWPLAKLKHTPLDLAEQVVSALLKLTPQDSAVIAANYAGWSIPLNYQSVHECLKTLSTGPYEDFGKVTFRQVIRQYRYWMLGAFLLGMIIVVFAIYISRLNSKLRRAMVVLEETARKRNEAVRLAEETAKLASIGVMAAGITHEINQPLNAIRLSADGIILWNQQNPGNFPDFLLNLIKEISAGSKRISEIIEHMRSFWSNPAHKAPVLIDLNEALREALELITRQIKNHQITLDLNLNRHPMLISGDALQMQQIISNLVTNAIHALDESTQKDKLIRITTSQVDSEMVLEVYDNGPGLPEQAQDKLFDPFYSTRSPGKGMGLGLAIVSMFVDRFNGTIEAHNNEEGGAIFTVRFPAVQNSGKGE